jgi:hypothetical protein
MPETQSMSIHCAVADLKMQGSTCEGLKAAITILEWPLIGNKQENSILSLKMVRNWLLLIT